MQRQRGYRFIGNIEVVDQVGAHRASGARMNLRSWWQRCRRLAGGMSHLFRQRPSWSWEDDAGGQALQVGFCFAGPLRCC